MLVQHSPYFQGFASKLGQPNAIKQIPLHKTTQIPCRAMDIKESTQDGNIEVVKTLLCRGGVGEPADKWFKEGKDIDMSEHIIVFHGDLLTKERLDSV
jgi:hypothetical protein